MPLSPKQPAKLCTENYKLKCAAGRCSSIKKQNEKWQRLSNNSKKLSKLTFYNLHTCPGTHTHSHTHTHTHRHTHARALGYNKAIQRYRYKCKRTKWVEKMYNYFNTKAKKNI